MDNQKGTGGSTGTGRRQRAPTITIDTTAEDQEDESLDPRTQTSPTESYSHARTSAGSRPTSPYNALLSNARINEMPSNFLAVPGSRSRANSTDSEDEYLSATSVGGDTVFGASNSSKGQNFREMPESFDNAAIINDPDALKEDPGTEKDFRVEDNKFAFTPGQLAKLLNPKSLSAFYALGGLEGIEKGLRTDGRSGISNDEYALEGTIPFESIHRGATVQPETSEGNHVTTTNTASSSHANDRAENRFSDRKRIFGDNRLPERKPKSIFALAWIAYNDKVLIILTVAAVISLALGLYQTFQPHPNGEARIEWVEGVAIVVAIVIVVVVGAGNDFQKERQFVRLNKKKEDRYVQVVRSGKPMEVSVYDIYAGDVMNLEAGDLIPVDGIFISGHNVKCDESSATGESDLCKKQPGDQVYRAIKNNEDVKKLDPFIVSGGKVSEGVGTFLVTSVGIHSSYGKTMLSLQVETEATPLQSKLNTLAEYIAKLGGAAGLLLFVVTLIKFLAKLPQNHATPSQKAQQFLQIFIVAVTIVVVAVPEGLPLAVTLALAFATTRMLKDNNLVRVLRACETMGNATTICSDKTGTLTQNKMSVVAATFGTSSRFGDRHIAPPDDEDTPKGGKPASDYEDDEDISAAEFVSTLAPDVQKLYEQSVVINSTAFEAEENGQVTFIGSKTETALLGFSRDHFGMGPVGIERSNASIVQLLPFDSARKCMAVVVKLDDKTFRMYVKGASEILLRACTEIIRDPTKEISHVSITHENITTLNRVITAYASRSLRTIGLLYRDFSQWPPTGARTLRDDPSQAYFEDVFKNMVFLGIVGIQDPLREGVKEAVMTCRHAGVFVRMVTGDNVLTAKAIGQECGIYTKGGLVMEGPIFRRLGRTEMREIIPRLQVLARSSPKDKEILVERLKDMGETVAVTGDGTNDVPALKKADVGFSMGISGTEVAKEASSIILMDDNFASIVKAMAWGRAVNDAVRKFLQFQVTVNITAVILTFVSAVASSSESSVLTAVQLLWVNLIMDTFAALALATDPPLPSILDRKPDPKSAPLITITMWKMIIGQTIYQLVVTLILNFGATPILSYTSARELSQIQTLVFNTFVWMQIFNQWNCRRLDNNFNIFEGLTKNYFFIGINVIIVAGQIMIVFVGGRAFSVKRLNAAQWAYSLVLGAFSIPVGMIIRLIPDEFFLKLVPYGWLRKSEPKTDPEDEQRFEWNPALQEIRQELVFLRRLRGGRLNQIKFAISHPREVILHSSAVSRSSSIPRTPVRENSHDEGSSSSHAPRTPESRSRRRGRSRSNSAFGPAAAMAGIVAGSIAGWSPIDRAHSDQGSFGYLGGRQALEANKGVEIHPETAPDDPIVADEPLKNDNPPSQIDEITPAFPPKPSSPRL